MMMELGKSAGIRAHSKRFVRQHAPQKSQRVWGARVFRAFELIRLADSFIHTHFVIRCCQSYPTGASFAPMNQDDSAPVAQRYFPAALKPWEALFLAAFAASIVSAACWQSHKSYLNNDELLTATLAANPDFGAMWNTVR